jgi:hypothetical protein
MIGLIWLEEDNIQWLDEVSSMGHGKKRHNLMSLTTAKKNLCLVGNMAFKKKHTVSIWLYWLNEPIEIS